MLDRLPAVPLAADTQLPQGLTPGDWLRAGVTLLVAVVVAGVGGRLLRRLLQRGHTSHLASQLVIRLVCYAVVAAGFLYALLAVHIEVGPLVGALGIGGLALALATQDILTNALGSVLLEVGRALHRGDLVTLGDHEGIVEDVDLRTVVLRTFDGDRVFVPNAAVVRGAIVNHTALGQRRTSLRIGVAYATDLSRAKAVAVAAAESVAGVLTIVPPQAFVEEFADSSITILLRFSHGPEESALWLARDAVAVAVKEAFDREGIEIAFPQRTLSFAPPPPNGAPDAAGEREARMRGIGVPLSPPRRSRS